VYLVDQAALTCPPVPQLRTQDLALFEELQGSAERPLSLILQDPTPGSIACLLGGSPFIYCTAAARTASLEI